VFKIGCYPFQPGFLEASAALVGQTLRRAQIENPETPLRILFSAHGLPESIIRSGDPYQWQCEQTAKKIAEYMDIPGLDWQACYQSRVGPMKWIGPSTDQALETAAKDRVGVIIYPHAFVSEHVETLVEIEEEYRHAAEKLGVPCFYRVPTVGTDPVFIAGLAELVEENLNSGFSPPGCPAEFKDCCQRAVA